MANPYRDKRGRFSSAGLAAMTIGGFGAMGAGIALGGTAGAAIYAAGIGSSLYSTQARYKANAQAKRIADSALGFKPGKFESTMNRLASGSMPDLDKQAAATLRAANKSYKKSK